MSQKVPGSPYGYSPPSILNFKEPQITQVSLISGKRVVLCTLIFDHSFPEFITPSKKKFVSSISFCNTANFRVP